MWAKTYPFGFYSDGNYECMKHSDIYDHKLTMKDLTYSDIPVIYSIKMLNHNRARLILLYVCPSAQADWGAVYASMNRLPVQLDSTDSL